MQRLRNAFSTDNTTMTIIAVAFALILIIIVPQVIPAGGFGVSCSELAQPIPGGNNQSILSERSEGLLALEVSLPRDTIATGSDLTINVTFINNGVGAVTLFFVPEEVLLRDENDANRPGLGFNVVRLADNVLLAEPRELRPPNPVRTQFPTEDLHVLGPRQRCTESLTFDSVRLVEMGLGVGRYAITAVYRNGVQGALNTSPQATATPIFAARGQGVYITTDLRSNTVDLNIGNIQPTAAVPTG
ncbi:MAG: hypothetical protein JW910_19605 [Anaerolineae bacterium]|nr:hypothetical protein [Anaerolineae bacterium]